MQKVTTFTLMFHNDGDECEHYGVYSTRAKAEAVIEQSQKEFGAEAFPSAKFDIIENVVV